MMKTECEIYYEIVVGRGYWDDLCSEFGRASWEKKLLNLALYIHYGEDLEVVLARYKENHPDYADRVPYSLAYYISYLRTGEAISVLNYFLLERVYLSESQLTALLAAELRERLHEACDKDMRCYWTVEIDRLGDEMLLDEAVKLDVVVGRDSLIFGNLTTKPFAMETKEILQKENPWRVLAEKIEKNDYMPLTNELNACAGDVRSIEEFNARTKNELFKLHAEVLPYPFIGNVLDAKVVVLMLNPSYVPDANEGDWGKLTEAEKRFVTVEQCKGMRLKDRKIYYAEPEYEAFNKIQTHYWMKKTRELRAAVPGAEERIAAIQLMGYHSIKYKSFPRNMGLMPSQEYTKRLIKYLISKGVVFVFARAVKDWRKFVPELKDATCVELKSYLNPCLTERNCIGDGFEKLKAALTE